MKASLASLKSALAQADKRTLGKIIVNEPFHDKPVIVSMGIGIIVLLIYDPTDGMIHRVIMSDTEMAEGTRRITSTKFEDIKIPLDYPDNIIAQAIRTGEPRMTEDWQYLFAPALSPEQARLNQAGGAIACSYVYPLLYSGGKGALIFSYYKESTEIDGLEHEFMSSYSKMVAERLGAAKVGIKTLACS